MRKELSVTMGELSSLKTECRNYFKTYLPQKTDHIALNNQKCDGIVVAMYRLIDTSARPRTIKISPGGWVKLSQ